MLLSSVALSHDVRMLPMVLRWKDIDIVAVHGIGGAGMPDFIGNVKMCERFRQSIKLTFISASRC